VSRRDLARRQLFLLTRMSSDHPSMTIDSSLVELEAPPSVTSPPEHKYKFDVKVRILEGPKCFTALTQPIHHR